MAWNPVFLLSELLHSADYGLPLETRPKIFVGWVPQDVRLPYVRVVSIFGTHREHMQGPTGLAQARLQADWWDTDAERLNLHSEMARIRVSGTRGTVDVRGIVVEVRRLHLEETELTGEAQSDGSGVPIYRVRQEWRADYEEDI